MMCKLRPDKDNVKDLRITDGKDKLEFFPLGRISYRVCSTSKFNKFVLT